MNLSCKLFDHKWNGCKCTRCGQVRSSNHDWNGCTCRICGQQQNWGHDFKRVEGTCRMACSICGTSRRMEISEYEREIKDGVLEGFSRQAVRCYCKQMSDDQTGLFSLVGSFKTRLMNGRRDHISGYLKDLFEIKVEPVEPVDVDYISVEKLVDAFSDTSWIMKKYKEWRHVPIGSIAVILAAFPEYAHDLTRLIISKTENSSNPVKNEVNNHLYYSDFSSEIDIGETEFYYAILKNLYSRGIQRELIETCRGKSFGDKPFYFKNTFDKYTAIPFFLGEQTQAAT